MFLRVLEHTLKFFTHFGYNTVKIYSVKPCLLPPCKVQWRDLVVVIDMDMVVDMDVVMGVVVVSLTVGASRKLWESWHHLHEIQRTGLSWNMM